MFSSHHAHGRRIRCATLFAGYNLGGLPIGGRWSNARTDIASRISSTGVLLLALVGTASSGRSTLASVLAALARGPMTILIEPLVVISTAQTSKPAFSTASIARTMSSGENPWARLYCPAGLSYLDSLTVRIWSALYQPIYASICSPTSDVSRCTPKADINAVAECLLKARCRTPFLPNCPVVSTHSSIPNPRRAKWSLLFFLSQLPPPSSSARSSC
jgi:hypothetical protein